MPRRTHETGHLLNREGTGTCLQDNRAVGNSRLAHMDVLSVSCKQVPDPDRWHCIFGVFDRKLARHGLAYQMVVETNGPQVFFRRYMLINAVDVLHCFRVEFNHQETVDIG